MAHFVAWYIIRRRNRPIFRLLQVPDMYERIRDLREDSDMSQQQMAEMLYINRRTYSSYEIGSRGMPIEILEKIADIFNTSTDYLLGRTEIRYPYPPVLPRNLD